MSQPDEDFRTNLIIDQNNPILVMKAWRDHDSAGWAYLAAPYGEDALTWNVFRFLDLKGPREVAQRFFGLRSPIEEFLFWGCDPDGRSNAQQVLSILLRGLDGSRRGTMTEPDLVILTDTEVCFVECKLSFAPAPWSARAMQTTLAVLACGTSQQDAGWKKRWGDYRARPAFQSLPAEPTPENGAVYQLVRNAIYAHLLAEKLGKDRVVVLSLTSRLQADLFPGTARQYAHVRGLCDTFATVADLRHWEDLRPHVPAEPRAKIQGALETIDKRVSRYIEGHISKLRSKDSVTRKLGQEVIAHLRPEHLLPHVGNLLQCLGHTNTADVQQSVAEAIDAIGVEAVPSLRKALGDANTQRRLACIMSLRRLGPAAAAAALDLRRLIDTPRVRQDVKRAAQEALRAIEPEEGQRTTPPETQS
jgi:hypothetical protein